MRDFTDDLSALRKRLTEAGAYLDGEGRRARLRELDEEVQRPGLWDDQEVANLHVAELPGERRHAAAALLDLAPDLLEARPQVVEVGPDRSSAVRPRERVTGAAARACEHARAVRRVDRRWSRHGRRRGLGILAVEPERARVPKADQQREDQTACDRKHERREAMQADDRDLGGVRAEEERPEQRVNERARLGALPAELEDAVVGDRQRADECEQPRPAVRRVDPRGLLPGELPEDPRGREDLEARQYRSDSREAGLQVDRVAEEQPKVRLRPRVVSRQDAGGQREERERRDRRSEPCVRPRPHDAIKSNQRRLRQTAAAMID